MTRREEVQTERRRRNDSFDQSSLLKLGVDPAKLDKEYEYRWINEGEHSSRLTQLTVNDDWDKVTPEEAGRPTVVAVGTQKNGAPENAYLCKKRKAFAEEDRAKKHRQSAERMSALRKGDTGRNDALNPRADTSYIPDEGISIKD